MSFVLKNQNVYDTPRTAAIGYLTSCYAYGGHCHALGILGQMLCFTY